MSMGDDILKDIKLYCEDNQRKIDEAAKKLMEEMKTDVELDTPVYKSNTGTHAKHLRDQWQAKAYGRTGSKIGSINYKGAVYAVKAKKKYQIVHLLNFPHKVVAHGQDTGKTAEPVMIIPIIDRYYQRRLDEEIERILNNG